MRCAFDPEGARLAVARLTGVYLFRVRRQEIADENPRCPADRLGVTREGRTHRCGDGTELAESGLKMLDIPAAMNSGAGGSPVSSRDSPRNQKMSAERAELARLGTHAHSILRAPAEECRGFLCRHIAADTCGPARAGASHWAGADLPPCARTDRR